jgi:3-hydroxyacyl-[acyl-carrier-protein] dehydratase
MTESSVVSELLSLDIKKIKEILPHRYPFLLVDRVLELDIENTKILAQKNVSINEEFFQGHFPHSPIMPGVLILEALAQAGGILFHYKEDPSKMSVLLHVKDAKFRNAVRPGDVLMLKVEGLHQSAKGGRIKGVATVGNKVAVEAEISFAVVRKDVI